MSVFDDVFTGSYAGVTFLALRSTVAGGQKDVIKEYPNSNKQTVEQLGRKVRQYTLGIVVSADRDGENYLQRRNNLLRVLEKGGKDVLVHPLYGRLTDIVVRSYTIEENFNDLGAGLIEVVFAPDTTQGLPEVTADTVSLITSSVASVNQFILQDVAQKVTVSKLAPANFTDVLNKINAIVAEFRNKTTLLAVTQPVSSSSNVITAEVSDDNINTFNSQLDAISAAAPTLVGNPTALGTQYCKWFVWKP
jgi:prophage DNA circulation protein